MALYSHRNSMKVLQSAVTSEIFNNKISCFSHYSLSPPPPTSGSWTAGWIRSKLKPNPWFPHSKNTIAQVGMDTYTYCVLKKLWYVVKNLVWSGILFLVQCFPGSVTQGPDTFSPRSESPAVGTAAKTKPCGSNSTPVPAAPTVEHKDTRGAFW